MDPSSFKLFLFPWQLANLHHWNLGISMPWGSLRWNPWKIPSFICLLTVKHNPVYANKKLKTRCANIHWVHWPAIHRTLKESIKGLLLLCYNIGNKLRKSTILPLDPAGGRDARESSKHFSKWSDTNSSKCDSLLQKTTAK